MIVKQKPTRNDKHFIWDTNDIVIVKKGKPADKPKGKK